MIKRTSLMEVKKRCHCNFSRCTILQVSTFMRELLLLVIVHDLLRPVQSVNGVIWDSKVEDFVPIFSVPGFAATNQERLSKSRRQETHNFQGEIVKFAYFEEMNLINGRANGTRISGVIGEIWNILSEFLNFTLKPIHSKDQTLGYANENGIYPRGLIRLIQRNETDVIPRVEAHPKRFRFVQFSVPLWKTSLRLYIRHEVKHLPTWMLKLFSRKVWFAILFTYFLLSVCSYLSQAVGLKIARKKSQATLNDYFFYNFGMICGQSYLPNSLNKSSRVVELWLGLFSCLIRTAFGALLIGYMTQISTTPPFHNLNSLLVGTSYNIFALKGSLPDLIFQLSTEPDYQNTLKYKRYVVAERMEDMYKTICSSRKPYAVYQSEDIKKAGGIYFCRLNPAGAPLFTMWIVSGISWNFRYKRSIDIGLLKLYEVGFIKLLKHRWIESKNVEEEKTNITEPITMEQVYLILYVFHGGLLISFIILLLEHLVFYFNK